MSRPSPLSFDAARAFADAHNPAVDASARGLVIREAGIRAARQRPNRSVGALALLLVVLSLTRGAEPVEGGA